MKESVILVNTNGQMVGTMDKMQAHRVGQLHRAFSVFVFNNKGELLLQQRAIAKYHSEMLWANTCCSHPKLGEKTSDAAHRRLKEEMGMDCELTEMFNFTYYANLDNDLIEHEFDHVFFGVTEQVPFPNTSEVADFKYVKLNILANGIKKTPEFFTEWLKICFNQVNENYNTLTKAHETMAD